MKEEFRDIVGYEGLYQVSNLGEIKSLPKTKVCINKNYSTKEKYLKTTINNKGYKRVFLYKNKKAKVFYIHRVVAQAFIPNPNKLIQVNHKDGNKQNNCIDNLEWISCSDNIKHAYNNGLKKPHNKYI